MKRFAPALLLALACGGSPSPDELAVLKAVLDRAAASKGSLPCAQLLTDRPFVLREEAGSWRIPASAAGGSWIVKSRSSIQAAADSARKPVYFVAIYGMKVAGSSAEVSVIVDRALPAGDRDAVAVCSVLANDEYRKADGRWLFKDRPTSVEF